MLNKFLKKSNPVVSQVCEPIEGDVVPALVEGATGDVYRGRTVVVFRHPSGLFGSHGGRERNRLLTLCKGIVNQCTIEEPPSPYWAVVDAMSDLRTGFTKSIVVERAILIVGEERRKACEMAWDVLRNHHRHARKKEAGMGFMLDSLPGGKSAIRARSAEETVQYFEAEGERRKASADLMRDLVDVAEVPGELGEE